MSLLIDIGNTRLKIGYANPQGIRADISLAVTPTELPLLLPWLQKHHLQPKRALIVSVASSQVESQVTALLESLPCPAIWLDSTQVCALVRNGYDQPGQLGSDRWLALIGVLAQYGIKGPIIHASFGTATTVDTLLPPKHPRSSQALFAGGLILPGPQLMYDSLANHTAKLGHGVGACSAVPTNTRAAISTGIAAAQAGAVLRQWQLAYELKQGTPVLICSGGGWHLVQEEIEQAYQQRQQQLHLTTKPVYYQHTPVLDGLAYMATQL